MNTIYQTKAEALATEQRIRDIAQSAYLGVATTTTTPPATGAYWYRVNTAGTYMGVTVTAAELNDNFVYLDVKDGVAEKSLSLKPTNKDYTTDVHINGEIKVSRYESGVNIQILIDAFIFDSLGGYRLLKASDYSFPNANNIIYLSGSKTEYTEVNLNVAGAGESVYLFSENYGTKPYYPNRKNAYSVASLSAKFGYVPKFPVFEITPKEVDRFVDFEQKGILPTLDYSRSEFYEKLLPFITKYQARNSDVTIVQTGDSISTNLGWTSPRADAMYRPPLMTEHNFNSFLEEKLRWREQKYRRFDAPGVFTEVLGGGTSTQMWDDGGIGGAWGITGNAYSLPLTKVIDGGTDAGVSYKFPAEMRRCNFILHTDYKWANSTKITVAEGNGKVEVKNEAGVWVEANNYEFSAQESATLINGAFRKSQEQKRIHMRSLTDLTEKNITIQNIGAGRFGYWGIEYSPNEFMFTYICASIGSQALYGMSFYESWRVDAFKPDLLLQQCCIINEGLISGETASPVITLENFTQHFADDYDRQISKGYLVMPYIVWGGAVMGMVNPSTGEWGFSTYNGKNLTVDDYLGDLMNMYNSKNAPAVNFFYRFTELAEKKAKLEGTNNIYTSAINGSGGNGNTFTLDTVHLNDYGNEILNRLLLPYFNF